MTSNSVHEVGPVDDFPDGEARRFVLDEEPIVVVRLGEEFKALGDVCSHDDYSLAEGEVDPDECTIECWKHGSLFDLNTGVPVTLPATRPVALFKAYPHDGILRIEVSSQP